MKFYPLPTFLLAAWLACLVKCGAQLPQTDCAASPSNTTKAMVDACRAAVVAAQAAAITDGGVHGG